MTMPPRLRELALTAHVASSVGWLGGVAAFLALAVVGLTSRDAQTVRGAYLVMEPAASLVLVPLSLASLLTGLVQALGTPWGLFRHYWVLFKLLLTVLATVVLVLHMPTVSALADVAREADGAALRRLGGDLFHPGLGLVVLLAVMVLNVYKPRGLTRYGWRKQQEQRRKTPATTGGTVQP